MRLIKDVIRRELQLASMTGMAPNAQTKFAQNPVEWAKIIARLMHEAGEVDQRALDERH